MILGDPFEMMSGPVGSSSHLPQLFASRRAPCFSPGAGRGGGGAAAWGDGVFSAGFPRPLFILVHSRLGHAGVLLRVRL